MIDGFYRIGQASKQLGVSSYHLRRLCQAGAIEAERTAGNQWRVPIAEVSRLQREGVPPIPQVLDTLEDGDDFEAGQPSRRPERGTTDGLYTTPSVKVINAAEDVVITENQLRKRRLERELEEEEDFFRGRAAQDQAQAEVERGRARKEHEEQMRREWESAWVTHALNSIPRDAPRELEVEVHSEVSETLGRLAPDHPAHTVRRLVESVTEKALAPWRLQVQQQRAIEAALDSLPSDLRYHQEFAAQKQEAVKLATLAVGQCRGVISLSTMSSAAIEAVAPIAKAFQHSRTCESIVAWTMVSGGSLEELEEARALTREAMSKLPIGSSRTQMERARDQALVPLIARIAERSRVEAVRAEERRRRQRAEWLVDFQLGHVDRYLSDAYDYPSVYERFADARRLREGIRPMLISECIADPGIENDGIRIRIEELVDDLI